MDTTTLLLARHRYSHIGFFLALCLIAAASLGSSGPAVAAEPDATITVTTVQDQLNSSPPCSLREAIQAANQNAAVGGCAAGSGDDVINLPAGIYRLTMTGVDDANALGDLDVFPVNEGEALTIQGAGAAGTVVDGNAIDRVLHLGRFGDLRLVNLTVQNGRLADGPGGGILAWGALRLENVTMRENIVTGASDNAVGGGMCVGCGPGTGQATLVNTLVVNNTARRGGGIFTNRPTEISASTVIGNMSTRGAGIANFGQLTLTNSTLSGNVAASAAAIAHEAGTLALLNSTIAQNTTQGSSGALLIWATATTGNTIVAANQGNNCQLVTPLTSLGNNLSSDATCAAAFTAAGDRNNAAPVLGPLRNNGGPTPTHALLWGSPAIDGGSNAGCPATDQRGVARPQSGVCDIGAVEFNDRVLFAPLLLRSTP
jgi:CSLREA domain-containing protein